MGVSKPLVFEISRGLFFDHEKRRRRQQLVIVEMRMCGLNFKKKQLTTATLKAQIPENLYVIFKHR